jgi:hypothetical protein
MPAKTPPPLWHRSLNLLRKAGSPARHISDLVRASNSFSDATRFHVRLNGTGFRDFDATTESVERAFEEAGKSASRGIDLPFVLGTDRKDPALTLSYLYDPLAVRGAYDRIEIAFDLSRPLTGPGGIFTFPDMMKYIAVCVDGFDAATGAVHDSRLFELVASGYTLEMSKNQLPPNQHKYIPVPEIVKVTPPDLFQRLSRVRHPSSFDLTRIPPAVFWINFWNTQQVRSVGEDRIRSAPWEFIAPHPRGGLLLATQKEEFDAMNPKHLERIARIVDGLDLYSVQAGKRNTSTKP